MDNLRDAVRAGASPAIDEAAPDPRLASLPLERAGLIVGAARELIREHRDRLVGLMLDPGR